MSVSSKWCVQRIDGQSVHLFPVCRGIENRQWAAATPGGDMRMFIQNEAALAQFEVGKEYEVVFREVPKPAPGDKHALDIVELPNGWNPKTGNNDKTYWMCSTCGSYPRLDEDGQPDWVMHREMFGTPEE